MIGLVSTFGYMGTTPVRSVPVARWNSFTSSYFQAKKGAPFNWSDSSRPKTETDKIYFDERLISISKYLSDGPKQKNSCAYNAYGDSRHDRIDVSVAANKTSDLTKSEGNPASPSTVERGVGLRMTGADKIKCTKVHVVHGTITKFLDFDLSFDPSNHIDKSKATICPSMHVCFCATDYYPLMPTDAPAGEINAQAAIAQEAASNPALAKVNPGVVSYDPASIYDYAHSAAIYKIAQITAQVLSVDKSGCQNSQVNKENKKIIPLSVIIPAYAQQKLDSTWTDYLMNLAKTQLPHNLQENSPLAGLSFDEALNEKGVHINY